jgi:hypothetical protein
LSPPACGRGRGRACFSDGRRGFGRNRPSSVPSRKREGGFFRHRHLLGARRFRRDRFLDSLLGLAVRLDHGQRRADRHHVADVARQFDDDARHRRFHLHGRLVGHHVGKLGVLLDTVADLDVPGDDLGLGDAFADVGQAE